VETLPASDAELLTRLRGGDEEAFRGLVRQMHRALMKLALAFVSSPSSAEEVVQETWLAVVGQLGQFEGRSSLRTWIGAIAVNRAKTRGVKEKRAVPFSALYDHDEGGGDVVAPDRFGSAGFWQAPPTPWDKSAETLLIHKQACLAIEEELEKLPPAQKAVVTLRDVEGWSSEEVCNVLEVTETHQRVLLHRGRMRLRAALERYHSHRAP
jgi:RNA polymerase sigma-70 factor (ECF subfamily)